MPVHVESCFRAALIVLLALVAGPAVAQSKAEPITLARGASTATVTGAVVRGDRALYTIAARKGQRMSLRLSSGEKNDAFQIYAPGAKVETVDSVLEVSGEALPGAAEGDDAAQWSKTVALSGSYRIVVGATRGNASYRLSVEVR